MANSRRLTNKEQEEANKVYDSAIDFSYVFISDFCGDGAMTLAGRNVNNLSQWVYNICWSSAVVQNGSLANNSHTLIHELAHVWQGQYGNYPTFYMVQSLASQLYHGVRDIIRVREWRGWSAHRGTTYRFNASDIGKDWSEFNVEQQASIVESWYVTENYRRYLQTKYFGERVYGGGMSPYDARFPYIRDVIRAGNPNAKYQQIVLANGASLEIKAIQDKLVELNYLEARHADGIISRGNSPTIQAVRHFQSLNSLSDDGDLGGPNSQTRKKLQLPISQLTEAPTRTP